MSLPARALRAVILSRGAVVAERRLAPGQTLCVSPTGAVVDEGPDRLRVRWDRGGGAIAVPGGASLWSRGPRGATHVGHGASVGRIDVPVGPADEIRVELADAIVLLRPVDARLRAPLGVPTDFRPPLVDDEPVLWAGLSTFAGLAAVLLAAVWTAPPPRAEVVLPEDSPFVHLVLAAQAPQRPPVAATPTAPSPRGAPAPALPAPAAEPAPTDAAAAPSLAAWREAFASAPLTSRGESRHTVLEPGLDPALRAALDAVVGPAVANVGPSPRGLARPDHDAVGALIPLRPGGPTDIGGGPSLEVRGEVHHDPAHSEAPLADEDAIRAVVEARHGTLVYCYERVARTSPDLRGRVAMQWTIEAGRVTAARVLSNSTGEAPLGECLAEKIGRWRFPAQVEGEVTWPFTFRPKGG